MNFRLRVRRQAEIDLERLYSWYERLSRGLGYRMLEDFEAALDLLVANPRLYAAQYRDLRRQLLRVFPVGVYFKIIGDVIHVVSVDHLARDPDRWKRRA